RGLLLALLVLLLDARLGLVGVLLERGRGLLKDAVLGLAVDLGEHRRLLAGLGALDQAQELGERDAVAPRARMRQADGCVSDHGVRAAPPTVSVGPGRRT